MNKKKRNIIISVISACAVVALTLGLVLGLVKFDNKQDEYSQGATSYWDASESRVDIDWAGAGTEENPYLITTAQELAGLSYRILKDNVAKESEKTDVVNGENTTSYYYSGVYFRQTVDLDVSAYDWTPIAVNYDRNKNALSHFFAGHYDGDGHYVTGVKNTDIDYYCGKGLFGNVSGVSKDNMASIRNLGVKDSSFSGYSVAGIANSISNTLIDSCCNYASLSTAMQNVPEGGVTSTGNYAGGIVRSAGASIISNCYNYGNITGASYGYAGGIVYNANNTLVVNCYNKSSIATVYTCGGIVGNAIAYPIIITDENGYPIVVTLIPTIKNCYNTGKIVGGTGLAGAGFSGALIGVEYSSYTCASACFWFYGGVLCADDGMKTLLSMQKIKVGIKTKLYGTMNILGTLKMFGF